MKSVLRQKNAWNVFNLFILLKEILSFDDLHYFEFWMPLNVSPFYQVCSNIWYVSFSPDPLVFSLIHFL